jgi:hypothetical protein
MDRSRFDTLTRLLATPGSRRAALGAILGGALIGSGDVTHAKRHHKLGRGNGRNQRQKRKQRVQAAAAGGRCCRRAGCTPGPGTHQAKCCYQGDDLEGANFAGANLRRASFAGANLTEAQFRGANLDHACFVDADVTGADFRGANRRGAVFCRTRTSNGIDNAGCDRESACCPTCVETGSTGCNLGGECCGGAVCTGEGDGVCVCESECCSNDDCASGQMCVSGACFHTCHGPTSCAAGSGGCPSPEACRETTSGALLCIERSVAGGTCDTDAECTARLGRPAICVLNEPGGCGPQGETHCAY